jgi:phenylalanyl-tRNA synthetase alpha chain
MENTKKQGTLHPMTLVINDLVKTFESLGFSVATGPELEEEWYNFDALNVAKDHPARDMQDTFWIQGSEKSDEEEKSTRKVLRTHTSPVQVRYMEAKIKSGILPPYAIVVPGKVFRNEATDATHEAQFHQIEGLFVGPGVSVAHMKGVLTEFFKRFLGEDAEVRLRPSFFPFVEPGFEVDVKRSNGKWLEALGAGMVHPHVFASAGFTEEMREMYTGFAFGMGLDRLVMLKYGITDVRYLYQSDLRLNQF